MLAQQKIPLYLMDNAEGSGADRVLKITTHSAAGVCGWEQNRDGETWQLRNLDSPTLVTGGHGAPVRKRSHVSGLRRWCLLVHGVWHVADQTLGCTHLLPQSRDCWPPTLA